MIYSQYILMIVVCPNNWFHNVLLVSLFNFDFLKPFTTLPSYKIKENLTASVDKGVNDDQSTLLAVFFANSSQGSPLETVNCIQNCKHFQELETSMKIHPRTTNIDQVIWTFSIISMKYKFTETNTQQKKMVQ